MAHGPRQTGDFGLYEDRRFQTSNTIQFLDAQAAIFRTFTAPSNPLAFQLGLGAFYITSFTSPFSFGYTNVLGPELLPSISYSRFNLKLNLGLVPTPDTLLFFSNSNLGFNLSYQINSRSSSHIMKTSLETSRLHFSTQGADILSVSTTLSFSFAL
jgi:hypothetical protein